ncbi:MAG: chemotaxis protein CheA [Acidobacteria bacterium]|nr:chemotaxis protein CheA [Acidobacteriota bacterium]MBI3662961.1 chemotaxis protein CheA [Acidobacteriota bacterium]
MSDDFAQDPALLQDFLTECGELLQQLDETLVSLETAPEDPELLNLAFRALHTIKGTSGFMGFTQIVEIAHKAEDFLNLLRKGERKINRHVMDVLLAVSDQLGRMFADLRNNTPQVYQLGELIAQLIALQAAEKEEPRIGEILLAEKSISRSELKDALQDAAQADPPKKLGEVLVEKQLVAPSQVREALEKQSAPAESKESSRTIRVDVGKLDELVNLVGELVLERNRLSQLNRDFIQQRFSPEKFETALAQSVARLTFITDELQTSSLKARMVPVDVVFRKFPRLVRDIARNLGKDVELVIRGEDTELDRTVVEEISDPLIHLVRNSLDHGVEAPDVRVARGKPRKGTLRLEASQQGDHIVIQIFDDGGGIDPEKIGRKAVEKGLITPERLQAMSRREILELIFLPGFSTAEKVSDVSGRGVGMDVVRTNLKKLNGVVELDSEVGKGSTVTLRLPLTLAILPALLVRVADDTFAVPLRMVVETVRIRAAEVHRVEGTEVFRLRDGVLPLLRLRRLFHFKDSQDAQGALLCVVIIALGEKRLGMVVDELLGQEETVIKPLGSYLRHVKGLAGATISGDGRVRLILDPAALASSASAIHA